MLGSCCLGLRNVRTVRAKRGGDTPYLNLLLKSCTAKWTTSHPHTAQKEHIWMPFVMKENPKFPSLQLLVWACAECRWGFICLNYVWGVCCGSFDFVHVLATDIDWGQISLSVAVTNLATWLSRCTYVWEEEPGRRPSTFLMGVMLPDGQRGHSSVCTYCRAC